MIDLDVLAKAYLEMPKDARFGYVLFTQLGNAVQWITGYDPAQGITRHPITEIKDRYHELSGKPTEWVHDWARFRAQDSDTGIWYESLQKPNPVGVGLEVFGSYARVGQGEVIGDWRETLEERDMTENKTNFDGATDSIESSNPLDRHVISDKLRHVLKTDESIALISTKHSIQDAITYLERQETEEQPKWNGEDTPPIGVECEFTTNAGYNWHKTTLKYKDGSVFLTTANELFKVDDPDVSFRPIRTDREIQVNAMVKAIQPNISLHARDGAEIVAREAAEALYDSGFKRGEG